MKERLQELRERWKGKVPQSALLALAAGCVLLLLPAGGAQEQESAAQSAEFDLAAFERQLEQAISRIEGAGESRVVLSLAGGERQVLARDSRQDAVETVTVGTAADERVVRVQTVAPEFRGALVVCPGAGDAGVRLAVTRAVSVLTGLGSDRICVTAGVP